MKVLIMDNYDSFVYNISQLVGDLGAEVIVRRNNQITLEEAQSMPLDAVIISPGPGRPCMSRDFGICSDILKTVSREVPTLGICLGHQGIAEAYGGKILRATRLMHGKASPIHHDGKGIYDGVENPFVGGRYHSLVVDPRLPPDLRLSSHTDDGVVMGIRHCQYPIDGVQFHPESILTPSGRKIISNFMTMVDR